MANEKSYKVDLHEVEGCWVASLAILQEMFDEQHTLGCTVVLRDVGDLLKNAISNLGRTKLFNHLPSHLNSA